MFTDRGRAYRATVHELPKERLTAAQNLFSLGDGERVIAILIVDGIDEAHTSLPQLLPLVRATGKVGALILGERDLRRVEAQLQARVAQLEREQDTLDEVVATIAHEVRQPLTSMRLSVQLAHRQVERVRQREAWSGWGDGALARTAQYLLLANRATDIAYEVGMT